MIHLPPRLAVGAIFPDHDPRPLTWALAAALAEAGFGVQPFRDRANLRDPDPAGSCARRRTRHLDSWLMSPLLCRRLLRAGTPRDAWAVVSGCYQRRGRETDSFGGGNLHDLAGALDIPKLAVLDVRRMTACRVPDLQEWDGFLLQGVESPAEALRWEITLALRGGRPVFGWLPAEAESVFDPAPGRTPCRKRCDALGRALLPHVRLAALTALAKRRTVPAAEMIDEPASESPEPAFRPRIAVAFDEVYDRYFPETLELLTSSGATLLDFSPLQDDRLPPDVDLVYFGDADVEGKLASLGANCCLAHALRRYANQGGRILAEGRGAIPLGLEAADRDGRAAPMWGLLPVKYGPLSEREDVPVEYRFANESWFAARGAIARGYGDGGPAFQAPVQRDNVLAVPTSLAFAAHPRQLQRMLIPPREAAYATVGADNR